MPKNRREFERNMFLLSEGLERDQVKISRSNFKTINGISNVRFAPNKRANLNTVDEMARLVANTVGQNLLRKDLREQGE